jgi:hypothetical protein
MSDESMTDSADYKKMPRSPLSQRCTRLPIDASDAIPPQPMDATETADFDELVVAFHHKASTVLTSNCGPDEWLAMISDAAGPIRRRPAHVQFPRTRHRR